MSDPDTPRGPGPSARRGPDTVPGPRPAADTLAPAAQSKAERALGWDDADLDSPEFRELGAPESSSLRTVDIEAASLEVATAPEPKLPPVEWALVSTVNALWAVLGPVLWLPVLLREVLVALLETAHGALTGQQSPRARRRLRDASRFVSGRFLDRTGKDAQKSLRRRAKPLRFVMELLWTAAVYAAALQALGFLDLPWRSELEKASAFWTSAVVPLPEALLGWLTVLPEKAPEALRELLALDALALGALAAVALLLMVFGIWLGARRR